MSTRSKRAFDLEHEIEEIAPLSPISSPLSKRQEQNRAAQRAFRERRAQTLKEMESRLIGLDAEIKNISKELARFGAIEIDIQKIKDAINSLFMAVDSMAGPTWTVPGSEDTIVENEDEEARPMRAVALRPSSTDPTLTSPNQ